MRFQTTTRFLSVDDHLEGKFESQTRRENVGGEVYAVVGAIDRYGLITISLAGLLSERHRYCCQVFFQDLRIRIKTAERDVLCYPDVLASCDPSDRFSAVLLP